MKERNIKASTCEKLREKFYQTQLCQILSVIWVSNVERLCVCVCVCECACVSVNALQVGVTTSQCTCWLSRQWDHPEVNPSIITCPAVYPSQCTCTSALARLFLCVCQRYVHSHETFYSCDLCKNRLFSTFHVKTHQWTQNQHLNFWPVDDMLNWFFQQPVFFLWTLLSNPGCPGNSSWKTVANCTLTCRLRALFWRSETQVAKRKAQSASGRDSGAVAILAAG